MARHELFLLHLGQMGSRDESGAVRYAQVPGYFIRAANGRTILVDTGNPSVLIGKETAAPWWPLLNDTRPEDDVVARLAELGIAPGGVDLLISTHFDFDHCGRHDAFAAVGTESVVQRNHLDAARSGNPRFDPALWDLPGVRYTAVEGDVELESGLRLLLTPGHVVGHQSVFVETADGPVILAIDAISNGADLEPAEISSHYVDPAEATRTRDRLVALAAETGALLIFGHDGTQWATLPKSPTAFRRS